MRVNGMVGALAVGSLMTLGAACASPSNLAVTGSASVIDNQEVMTEVRFDQPTRLLDDASQSSGKGNFEGHCAIAELDGNQVYDIRIARIDVPESDMGITAITATSDERADTFTVTLGNLEVPLATSSVFAASYGSTLVLSGTGTLGESPDALSFAFDLTFDHCDSL